MQFLIWTGAIISVLGLAGLAWCILTVAKAKRAGLSEDEMRLRLQRIVAVNLVALFVSVIGLMIVVVGIFLR
ncbi:hypothetical protein RPE78_00840 [Thioclava litoralis]|uniref:Hypoxia induced protein conserved region n=1 Tax=Thioclava litoralis TaxID=3076557 RepID=A0ABZ1DYM6_9RHOB|nr:hypothetical protein RPE78_00840 [Thioclava sp. FTW29]